MDQVRLRHIKSDQWAYRMGPGGALDANSYSWRACILNDDDPKIVLTREFANDIIKHQCEKYNTEAGEFEITTVTRDQMIDTPEGVMTKAEWDALEEQHRAAREANAARYIDVSLF